MKNNGLKIPEKDQIMSKSYFHTITELKLWVRFLVFCLNVSLLMRRLACSIRNFQGKQWMYITDIFLKTPLSIYFNFFPNFFPKFEFQNLGCGLSASVAYTPVFTVLSTSACWWVNLKKESEMFFICS